MWVFNLVYCVRIVIHRLKYLSSYRGVLTTVNPLVTDEITIPQEEEVRAVDRSYSVKSFRENFNMGFIFKVYIYNSPIHIYGQDRRAVVLYARRHIRCSYLITNS